MWFWGTTVALVVVVWICWSEFGVVGVAMVVFLLGSV